MSAVNAPKSVVRTTLVWMVLAGTVALAFSQSGRFANLSALGLRDYIAYWSAGRLNALGINPYSPEELLPVQQDEGWDENWPNIMYYPPWALSVVMPFGVISYGMSRLVWLVFHLVITLFCADRLWRLYGGPEQYRWVAWLLSLSFVPTLIVLRMGQIGPLILLGIVAFLYFETKNLDWLAGAALMLTAIKPQLVYLFGLAVVVWSIDRRRWRVLAGGIAAILGATLVALWRNPLVLDQYRYALANPPSGNITPTLGAMLRLIFGEENTWLQFMPTVAGMLWFPFYWLQHRKTWVWIQQTPLLLLVSFLTTSYGSWVFDLVILLVPVLQGACWVFQAQQRRTGQLALVTYLAVNAIALVMNLQGATYPAFIWMTPTLLLGYLILRWQRKRQTPDRVAVAG